MKQLQQNQGHWTPMRNDDVWSQLGWQFISEPDTDHFSPTCLPIRARNMHQGTSKYFHFPVCVISLEASSQQRGLP